MKVYLAIKKSDSRTTQLAAKVREKLACFGISEVTREHCADADLFIALGGDGTIVHAAKKAAEYELPVLGINSGRVGFLAGLEWEELNLLSRLSTGEYDVEQRMLLAVDFMADGKELRHYALNEAAVTRDGFARLMDISVSENKNNGNFTYRADGLLFATPTGSTAYSLSAGGPVVDPLIEGIVVTPLCPFSLQSRAMVFSSCHTLYAKAECASDGKIALSIDGETPIDITGQTISVSAAKDRFVRLIRIKQEPFFNAYKNKIIDRSI